MQSLNVSIGLSKDLDSKGRGHLALNRASYVQLSSMLRG